MTVHRPAIEALDAHWAISAIPAETRARIHQAADARIINLALAQQVKLSQSAAKASDDELARLATAYELAAIEGLTALLHGPTDGSNQLRDQAPAGAYRAFELHRALPLPSDARQRIFHVLHVAALAYASDRWTDLRRWLRDSAVDVAPTTTEARPWDERILFETFDCWVRLLRKSGWDDLSEIALTISRLREAQQEFERDFLNSQPDDARPGALRLVALYHWVRGTEILAEYVLQGEPRNVEGELDFHFEHARDAAGLAHDAPLEVILRWLHVASRRMVASSVWSAIGTQDPRLSAFAKSLTRSKRSMFELLPPQRAALVEQGLLDPASRAVVVDMPTSGGKTVLAEFRILQALNFFEERNGWVAYVAPTRALVSQVTRRLREDFAPMGIAVEQLSAAVEIDSYEENILASEGGFKVLVATPEKLHLVLRNRKVGRPLALLVMDEAQNIENTQRGLRIELLLAMVKRDYAEANFLLLMPFVPNAKQVATWLSPETGRVVSLGTSPWSPNDLLIGMYRAVENDAERAGWHLEFETLTSPRRGIQIKGKQRVGKVKPLNAPWSKVNNSLSKQTAAMARIFATRGTSIAVARRIPDAWMMAREIAKALPDSPISPEVELVQRFLATEISSDFELIELLKKGVGVHHAGLSDETRTLMEWLAETGRLRVLCATTTIAQGINFPVASVFLASRQIPSLPPEEMSPRAFWNLAGRAGRMNQDSVGVVGLAAGDNPAAVRKYVSTATGELISQLVTLLDDVESRQQLGNLSTILQEEQWTDFRSYVAHLWAQKQNLNQVLAETEQLLRQTYGYASLQARTDEPSRKKARALLDATKSYAQRLSAHPEDVTLAEATGFAPEGVRIALGAMSHLSNTVSPAALKPESLFGSAQNTLLPNLIGVMMRVPEIKESLKELGGEGLHQQRIADITRAWVMGHSMETIARDYFSEGGDDLTKALSEACRGVYKLIGYAGTWGLSAILKMPTAGIDYRNLSDDDRRAINALPAMLYHGVHTEAAVVMRMNDVPRSVAERAGAAYLATEPSGKPDLRRARAFLRAMGPVEWQQCLPENAAMNGQDCKLIWSRLSGESV